jgi:hypothetical protein
MFESWLMSTVGYSRSQCRTSTDKARFDGERQVWHGSTGQEMATKLASTARFSKDHLRQFMALSDFTQRIEISFWIFVVFVMKDKKAIRCALLSLLLGVFLTVGVFSAAYELYAQKKDDRVSQNYPVPTSSAAIPATNSQRNVLVILMDHLVEQNPKLEGVWLVVYMPNTPHLTFLPIFPVDLSGQTTQDISLASLFHLDSHRRPTIDFLEAIEAKDIRWDDVLVFDKVSLAVLIDLSGGLESKLELMSGTNVVSQLPDAYQEPRAALENQAALAEGICQKMDRLIGNPDTTRLLELLAGRVYSETEFTKHFPGWSYFRDFGGNISCEFPTFGGISSLAPTY